MPLAKVRHQVDRGRGTARAAKASAIASQPDVSPALDDPSQIELPPVDEDEPLELDDAGHPRRAPRAPAPRSCRPARRSHSISPAGRAGARPADSRPGRGASRQVDDGCACAPRPRDRPGARSGPSSAGGRAAPDDAILTPEPEDLVAPEHEDESSPEEFGRQGGPIVDLLSSGAEEENRAALDQRRTKGFRFASDGAADRLPR